MRQNEAKLEEWQQLYQVFNEFKNLECWKWIYDSDLFGVENPEDKVIGYCCVLGKLGRFKGLAVYEGTEGLESYLKICSNQNSDIFDPIPKQKCLIASIEKSNQLEAIDFEVISKLGLEFSSDDYPFFRNHSPGYLPWYLNSYDVKFLTVALQQTINIAKRCKNNKKLITKNNSEFLVRVFEENEWQDKYLTPDKLHNKQLKQPILEQNYLDSIKNIEKDKEEVWELAYICVPTPVKEGNERPYYPYIMAIIAEGTTTPVGIEVCDFHKINIKLPGFLIRTCKESNIIPDKIIIKQEEIADLLKILTKTIGIKLSVYKKLKTLEPIIQNLASIVLAEQKMM